MRTTAILLVVLALPAWGGSPAAEHPLGRLYDSTTQPTRTRPRGPSRDLGALRRWNQIAIDASGLDHTPVAPGETRTFGEQIGPGRSSRAVAIVHIAMFDSINAVARQFESYTGVQAGRGPLSLEAAISQAAHDTLASLFPSQAASFAQWLAEDLAE